MFSWPMRSLWAYIEGMDGLCLPIDRDQQLRFWWLGQIWHFDPLQSAFTPPVHLGASQFFYAVASMFSWPMRSLWAHIEGMVDFSFSFTRVNPLETLPRNALMVLLDAAEYCAAYFYIVFETHMEALDGYWRGMDGLYIANGLSLIYLWNTCSQECVPIDTYLFL